VGAVRVNTAGATALEREAINVGLIGRMLKRAAENNSSESPPAPVGTVVTARLAPDPGEFTTRSTTGNSHTSRRFTCPDGANRNRAIC